MRSVAKLAGGLVLYEAVLEALRTGSPSSG